MKQASQKKSGISVSLRYTHSKDSLRSSKYLILIEYLNSVSIKNNSSELDYNIQSLISHRSQHIFQTYYVRSYIIWRAAMRILYIDIDSLRPDHLSCYGYGRVTSPNIDLIASRGGRLTNCFASDVPCLPSRTSLFSGRLGIHHGGVAHNGTRTEPFSEGQERRFRSSWSHTAWMRQLRDLGHRTVTFSGFGERHSAFNWYAGFQEIYDTGHFGKEIADDVTPVVLDWLNRNGKEPNWFLHVNYWDVHVPYRTPSQAGNPFANVPLPDPWLSQEILDLHRSRPGLRSPDNAWWLHDGRRHPDRNPANLHTVDDFHKLLDGYDTSIAYVDTHVGRIMAQLMDLGIEEEVAIIVSSDHGECLGELGAYGGHCFADACTGHVPLVICWPGATGIPAGSSSDALQYNIDVAATVVDLLGGTVPDIWDARSFADSLRGKSPGRRELVVSQLAQSCQRSVVFRHDSSIYFYLRSLHSAYHLLPREMLFNLTCDPHETKDLAGELPELVKEGRTRLDDWRRQMLAGSRHPDPLDTVLSEPPEVTLEKYAGWLKGTSREHWIEKLRKEQSSSMDL